MFFQLVVLTDGYRDLVNPNDAELKIPEMIKEEITCIVINHSGCQVIKHLSYSLLKGSF